MDPVDQSLPVDVRVPFHSLQDVRAFLGYHNIHSEIMIQDLQVVRVVVLIFDAYNILRFVQ